MNIIKVSSKSDSKKVAGLIAGKFRNNEEVEIESIGAGAINQAIKAIIIARGFLAPLGIDLIIKPSFIDVIIDGEEKTAIKLMLKAN